MLENATIEFGNCSNSSNISDSVEEYLYHLQDKTNITMIPAVIMMIIFAVTGLIGNSLVLVVYSQKYTLNPTKVLIMTIAIFDLVSNVGAIPSEINIMFDSWNFSQPGVCKSKVFLGSFTTVGGAISLLVVAVVRYRKVCKPYGWQVTIEQSIIASIVTGIIAFLFSIPYIIIYGIKTRQTPCSKIQGYECFASDYYFDTIWPLLNNILFVLLYLSLSISMIVLYILIGLTAWRHSKMFVVSRGTARRAESATTQPVTRSNLIKSKLILHERIHALLCCTHQQKDEKNVTTTQSSNITKTDTTTATITTTDVETEGTNSETMNSEVNQATARELSSPLSFNVSLECVPCHHLDHNNLNITELSAKIDISEKGELFQTKESHSSNTGTLTRNHYLIDDISNDEDGNTSQSQETEMSSADLTQPKTSATNHNTSKTPKPGNQEARRRPMGRMTVMLIIISAIFVLGFFPFLLLTVFKNRLPQKYASLNMVELTFFNLFYRLYFLNSAVNPVIYSLCNTNFKRECIRLMTMKGRRRL